MLKILVILLAAADALIFLLLCIGVIFQLTSPGGINFLLPGLGLVVSLNFILILLFLAEFFLVALTWLLYRFVKNRSERLA